MSDVDLLVGQIQLSDAEFHLLQKLFFERVGLQLPPVKRALVCGRLAKRLAALGMESYQRYYDYLISPDGAAELETAIDLITTHETYFFREPQHFTFLERHILPQLAVQQSFRAWSAASSTGEEAYTLAMVLGNCLGTRPWSVVGSDISLGVLRSARKGLFPQGRGAKIPAHLLKRYCLKGCDRYEGYFLIERELRKRVEFLPGNLTRSCAELGQFDLILLRNVLIYFDLATKQQVLANVLDCLKPGGWLMVGHSESLQNPPRNLELQAPSVYRKMP